MNKCGYCCDFSETESIINKSIPLCWGTRLNISIGVNNDKLNVYMYKTFEKVEASDGKVLEKKINFCPMCGRKLEMEE